ncbi:hypothetical protein PSTT_05559 [Puccinia striiformis]|uniref:Uncharacterized protein n=1 Tax=Puccinia striiformis TaxID=27350 RepID=A0A2S4VNM4_9BASI|nr:hypothetical protein PSTT_05559 [Puccinia striiformis]
MNSNERFHLPDQLTRNNFLDWEGKVISVLQWKDLYDLVLDKEEKCCDEKVKITFETVLDLLDSQIFPETKPITTPLPQKYAEPGEASALLTQKCPDGRHLPSASHTSKKCFSLHPELLVEYQKHMKAKAEAEAHLTLLLGPSMYNVEVSEPIDSAVNKLATLFDDLPGNLASGSSDGYKSEVSLI